MFHRPYQQSDKQALIDILRANTPKYFSPADEADFIQYLDDEQWGINYVYLSPQGQVIGCAGSYLTNDDTLNLCWAFFRPGSLGYTSIPRVLADYISAAANDLGINSGATIVLNTTQMIARYLSRIGFQIDKVEPDGYGPGYDLVTMTKKSAELAIAPNVPPGQR